MKVGFIGLGIMGKPMASHLINNGFETYLLDLNREAVNELVELGGHACESNKEIAEKSDVIITMLPTADHVKQVLFSLDGVAKSGKPGTTILDMSSVAPEDAKTISEKLQEYDMSSLDAPVSGGEPMAIEGRLAIMVGGSEKDYKKVLPILEVVGENIIHVGDNGAGSTVKLANQIIVNANIAVLSEAVVLASKSGIDLKKMYEAIRGGLAGSAVMDAKMPKIIERNFEAGGRIDINFKDLNNVLNSASQIGVPLPITTQVREIFHSEMVNNNATKDHSFVLNYFEKMANHQTAKGGKN
ncbi:2-hydroxy-3-oxopropionate reductase [Virgibacillus sp. MSJ-26]|uniref:2-hydroxy-3-oxopropionate reductase n=1 Tax=Virgibacillus sp. MSJ-26 TaxID=2841522 RepID=UPI0035304441